MNTELGFLVFVLYFLLFLDLYSTFAKLSFANGGRNTKKLWDLKRNCLEEKNFGRETLAMRKVADAKTEKRNLKAGKDFAEIHLRREILLPSLRNNGQIAAGQKARLWGRT